MDDQTPSQSPVTVVVSRMIAPGKEAAYEEWVQGSMEQMRKFPGFLGAALQKPTPINPHWVFMPRWQSTEHLMAWDSSPELAARVELLEPLIVGGTQRQRIEGLDFWFVPPGEKPSAPKWKMMLVTIAVLWPVILLLQALLGPVEAMVPLWWAKPVVLLVVMVPLLEYVVMPLVTRALRGWLFK